VDHYADYNNIFVIITCKVVTNIINTQLFSVRNRLNYKLTSISWRVRNEIKIYMYILFCLNFDYKFSIMFCKGQNPFINL